MYVAIRGNDFYASLCAKKAKLGLIDENGPNNRNFCQVGPGFLTILGVKNVVLWTVSKLFRRCFESICVLFSSLKGLLLIVYSAQKVDKCSKKSRFLITICSSRRF